jgi:hypothetical protein
VSVTVEKTERCAWCNGHGSVLAGQNFLLARLRATRDYRWIGTSSDAMVVAAMTGEKPSTRPYDGWDLGRCMVTRAVAPEHLHERMDEIIKGWIALLETERPYYGVKEARAMVEEHAGGVRELIESFAGPAASAPEEQ